MLDEVRLEEQEKLKQMADEAKRRKQEEVITAGMEAITVAMETNSSIDLAKTKSNIIAEFAYVFSKKGQVCLVIFSKSSWSQTCLLLM